MSCRSGFLSVLLHWMIWDSHQVKKLNPVLSFSAGFFISYELYFFE